MEAQWISVDDSMPPFTWGGVMIVFETGDVTRKSGGKDYYEPLKRHVTVAQYYPPMTCKVEDYWSDCDDDFHIEKDENGVEFIKGGFYETMYNSEQQWWVGERVTHWMPLPSLPEKQQNEEKQDGNG